MAMTLLASATPFVAVLAMTLRRWAFRFEDHEIEVRNHVFGESVSVDGVVVPHTKAGGGSSHAIHRVILPGGSTLQVRVERTGFGLDCIVHHGDRAVFSSSTSKALGSSGGHARIAVREETDPRLTAAQVLLDAIGVHEKEAAEALGEALRRVLRAERAGREAEAAHRALGGAATSLVADRVEEVEEVLATIRELHLAVSGGDERIGELLDRVRETTGRLAAAREVEEAPRARPRPRVGER